MQKMIRGFRGKLGDYLSISQPFRIEMETIGNAVYESFCLGTDSEGKVTDSRFMVYENRTAAPDESILFRCEDIYQPGRRGQHAEYTLKLNALPAGIQKLVFCVDIDGSGKMGDVVSHTVRILQDDETVLELELAGKDFQQERAVVSIELYLKSVWRVAVVAAGYNDGRQELLGAYGAENAEEVIPAPAPVPVPAETPKAPEPAPAAETGTVTPANITQNPRFARPPKKKPEPAPVPAETPKAPEPAPAAETGTVTPANITQNPRFARPPKKKPEPAPAPAETPKAPESAPAAETGTVTPANITQNPRFARPPKKKPEPAPSETPKAPEPAPAAETGTVTPANITQNPRFARPPKKKPEPAPVPAETPKAPEPAPVPQFTEPEPEPVKTIAEPESNPFDAPAPPPEPVKTITEPEPNPFDAPAPPPEPVKTITEPEPNPFDAPAPPPEPVKTIAEPETNPFDAPAPPPEPVKTITEPESNPFDAPASAPRPELPPVQAMNPLPPAAAGVQPVPTAPHAGTASAPVFTPAPWPAVSTAPVSHPAPWPASAQYAAPPVPAPMPAPPVSAPMPAPAPSAPSARVELRKGVRVSLEKRTGSSLGQITVSLNWNRPHYGAIDLDLECLYELANGKKFGVQALGKNFGSFNKPPYIELDGDDRSGGGGETLRINGDKITEIKRILIFTSIYEGPANWEEASGVVTVKCPGNPDLVVRMDSYHTQHKICAIALLENRGGTFSVEKLVEYFESKPQMDRAYQWGLKWKTGSK